MPRYLIVRIKGKGRTQKVKIIGMTPQLKSIRLAWTYYKKNFKRSLIKGFAYHLFPLNHSRFWEYNGKKWIINSWYGNHDQKKYREGMSKTVREYFEKSEKIKINQQDEKV